MNTKIKTLHDALAFLLRGLIYAERKVNLEFKACSRHIQSGEVKDVIESYLNNADNVSLKLDRIFNYLMLEPLARKNEVIDKMIEDTKHLLTYTSTPHLKEILMIGCLKNVNAYKTASFQSCYLMAIEQDLDTAADMIQQILEWELSADKRLAALAIHEFNKLNTAMPAQI